MAIKLHMHVETKNRRQMGALYSTGDTEYRGTGKYNIVCGYQSHFGRQSS